MTTVTITEDPLALEDLLAIVDGAQVELADGVRTAIAASRSVVDAARARNDAVYGLTTQVGYGKDTRLTEEEIRSEQMFLVMSHSGGVGPPLPLRTCGVRWSFDSMGLRGADRAHLMRPLTCWPQCSILGFIQSFRRSDPSERLISARWPEWPRSRSEWARPSIRASSFLGVRRSSGPGSPHLYPAARTA